MPRSAGTRAWRRPAAVVALVAAIVLIQSPAAWAGSFTSPKGTTAHPFVVPVNAKGAPVPFTVSGTGWTPKSIVYEEVCDGVSPGTSAWMPTADCDEVTEPAGVMADAKGDVTFPATNINYQIGVFRGESPQQLFNCLSPKDADPRNGLRSFRNCQIRLTTNDTLVSATDAFLPIALPNLPAGASSAVGASGQSTTTSGHSASAGSNAKSGTAKKSPLASTGARIVLLVSVGAVLIAVGCGAILATRRRRVRVAESSVEP